MGKIKRKKNPGGRPRINPYGQTVYLAIGNVAVTPDQATIFRAIIDRVGSVPGAIRALIDKSIDGATSLIIPGASDKDQSET